MDISIFVMIFIKDDLLNIFLDNLKQVIGIDKCHILFMQDNVKDSYIFGKYYSNFMNCKKIISDRLCEFKNAEYICNDTNKGVYNTHYNGLDYCYKKNKYVIFIEDDVMVSKNFLNYFKYFIDNNLIGMNKNIQFVGAESMFFNLHHESWDDDKIIKATNYINTHKLYNLYSLFNNWCTSSCFCTSNDVWEKIKHIKQQIHSDNKLNNYCKEHDLKLALPVVPLCRDIGMLHDLGLSVTINGKKNVKEIKNVLNYDSELIIKDYMLEKNKDKLYGDIRNILNT